MEFKEFKIAVQKQFQQMQAHRLYSTDVGKDLLWDTYLKSFPEGSNPIFRERTEHDCSCCKSFIRTVGGVVAIVGGECVSIWDVEVGGYYQVVADALAAAVKSQHIADIFLHPEHAVGVDRNQELFDSGVVQTWEHFYIPVPPACYCSKHEIGSRLSNYRSTYDVAFRGLSEITLDALDTVLELVAQNSLYRGEEHESAVRAFRAMKVGFAKAEKKDIYCWSVSFDSPAVARIRNTAIGTLLVDLSEGVDLDQAVRKFEAVVAPTNYKRPTALVTKAMVEKAQKDIEELGLTSALKRRYAVLEDITINNVLFADRSAKKAMNVFDDIATKPITKKNLDKVESVEIETFVKEILPKADSIELMVENKHTSNFVSLIAPAHIGAKAMFKWHNNFSWSYAGEVADSIKERVKRAGGKIDGYARFSLSWSNYDDLDLHMVEVGKYEIFFGNKNMRSPSGGWLDVDMNAGHGGTRTPVENIVYAEKKYMRPGTYRLFVRQFCKRETKDIGFEVEMEVDRIIRTFVYDKPLRDREAVVVLEFVYDKDGIVITKSLPSTQSSKKVWGVDTQQFHKVNVVMVSPNYWDEKATGNKHYFFMLENCWNDGTARGFYNEFLAENLSTHRKVFEILGSKMKVEPSENQLSGLGFSSTQRNEVFCRVTGSFSRTIKITF